MKALFKCVCATFIGLLSASVFGQECDVPMCVVIDKGFSNVTPESASILENQLQRMANQSGFNTGWQNAGFALTAKLDQKHNFSMPISIFASEFTQP